MSSFINKSDFFAAITGQAVEWDAPGIGKIKLRGLTIQEFNEIRNRSEVSAVDMMLEWIQLCMVVPQLDKDDIVQLWKATPGKIQPIGDKIAVLSGIKDDKASVEDLEKKAGNGS